MSTLDDRLVPGRECGACTACCVSIAIDEKGQVFLMDQPVETTQLLEKLKEAAKQGVDERIYVRGSKAVNYGRVAEVMSLVTTAGYKKVALVTEQEKK